METWKFVTLFLLIWLPLWAYFEVLTRTDGIPRADEEVDG